MYAYTKSAVIASCSSFDHPQSMMVPVAQSAEFKGTHAKAEDFADYNNCNDNADSGAYVIYRLSPD
jgi:hypothetical protein